ncbi:MAG: SsrA-binding protein SmpB [Candidatus Wildermuthbacteria bacterium]|nr:SsrA-binding protein SmpB [Candidatus Wildermuthbacteria bacterium]
MDVLAENRKARFNYEILETFQAGLSLQGPEVKSARLGRMQLAGSYAVFKGHELSLVGSTIPPYQPNNTPSNYKPERSRKLLLNKKELLRLSGKVKERGLTLVPLKVYSTEAGKIKLEIGLAKGKKKWDKREALKKREADREIKRALRG